MGLDEMCIRDSLERVTIPSGIGTIGGNDLDDGCFSGCDSLAEVVIEEGVSCIGTVSYTHLQFSALALQWAHTPSKMIS